MKVDDAIKQLGGPTRGVTSIIAGLFGGDIKSISGKPADGVPTLAEAEQILASYKKAMNSAQSDAAYWGYYGDVCYWEAVVSLLKAAEIVGPDNLPDLPFPKRAVTVMDAGAEMVNWGRAVLQAAQKGQAAAKVARP